MSITPAFVVSLSLLVQDAAGHVNTKPMPKDGAEAIASVCNATKFPSRCAAILAVLSFRESGNNHLAVHDGGKGCGAYGVLCRYKHDTWLDQVKSAWGLVVYSATMCEEPLALYASGSCRNKAGIEISKNRIAESKRVEALANK